MNESGRAITFPPFPAEYRASGILLHTTSLPSPYGIGDLGPAAYSWIDRLHESGQTWWQALPLGPTGYGNSPYQSLSSFVGNALMVSPELLIEDGLLQPGDCHGAFSSTSIDYETVIPFKHRLLKFAWTRFRNGARKDLIPEYEQFCRARASWLDDYALFRALKETFNGVSYLAWPADLVQRVPHALAQSRRYLADEIDLVRLSQFLLFRQAKLLTEYAHERGIRIIGDLPFFVSPDSCDVWANPELFLLDENFKPRFVAGVPPDYFSAQGQLWRNPVYDWDALRDSGYSWWIERFRALLNHVDVIRLDHFRALAAAWHVPPEARTAETGAWLPGPGAEFLIAVQKALGGLPFIAEDLGLITPDVTALRDEFEIPGTRVLQFAFDGVSDNPHLPHNCPHSSVIYTGTHDNATTREWYEGLPDRERQIIWQYLRRPRGAIRDVTPELIRLAWSSPAALAVTPLQDLLNLGSAARMNVPGRAEGNWRWRATPDSLSSKSFERLKELTATSNRSGRLGVPETEAVELRRSAAEATP
jgi:4-alpha-glucanotransferase